MKKNKLVLEGLTYDVKQAKKFLASDENKDELVNALQYLIAEKLREKVKKKKLSLERADSCASMYADLDGLNGLDGVSGVLDGLAECIVSIQIDAVKFWELEGVFVSFDTSTVMVELHKTQELLGKFEMAFLDEEEE